MISVRTRHFGLRTIAPPGRPDAPVRFVERAGSHPEPTRPRTERIYVPSRWERHFPWILDVTAALDPEPVLGRVAGAAEPLSRMVEASAVSMAGGLEKVGRRTTAAGRRVATAAGRVLAALPLPGAVRRSMWIDPPRPRRPDDTVHTAYRREYRAALPTAIMTAAALHAVVFMFAPPIPVADLASPADELVAVDLPPEVAIPAPPPPLARPATPIIASSEIAADVTIAPTTFDAFADVELPQPPPPTEEVVGTSSAASFTPYTVAPRIVNLDEIYALMARQYPPMLRRAGIGGTVRIMALVNADGAVERAQIAEGSGYGDLDDAAMEVAMHIRCSPAMNRDTPVAAWIGVPLEFSVR